MKARSRILIPVVLLVALIAVAGCKKKQVVAPTETAPPPASAPAPTAQITATPVVISAGDQDLAACACDTGYGVGVIAALRLTHLIPASRLTLDYQARLAEGIYFSLPERFSKTREGRTEPEECYRLVESHPPGFAGSEDDICGTSQGRFAANASPNPRDATRRRLRVTGRSWFPVQTTPSTSRSVWRIHRCIARALRFSRIA